MQPIFPFEKNRYFPRKRMRSADFTRELAYIDHKFQLLSRWTFGVGPVLGLAVQRLDSDSLLVSPGMAVDDLGRCVIVDEPAVCRIRSLPGFDGLRGESALLWLSYAEKQKEPVSVAGEDGERSEFTVATEGFSFSLSEPSPPSPDAADGLLYSIAVLYEDDAIRVTQAVPRLLSSQRPARLRLLLENLTLEPMAVSLRYQPELPGFRMESGERQLCLDQNVQLPVGFCTLELTVVPDTAAQSVSLSLPEEGLTLRLHGRSLHAKSGFREELQLTAGDPLEALAGRLRALSLQELWGEADNRGVPIAGVRFLRYDEGFLLDDVFPLYPRHTARFPAVEQRLSRCGGFFPEPVPPAAGAAPPASGPPVPPAVQPRHMTTGTVTLHAGLHLREGAVLRSGELVHQLGPGTVYVDFGIEQIYPLPHDDRNGTDLLLGDPSLFVQASGSYPCSPDRGVRLHPDRGTFELALRLKGDPPQASLRLRWFAWRPEETAQPQPSGGKLLRLEPSVCYAQPGATVHFAPVFDGEHQPCVFSVPEKQSGLITPDGVYTAPRREGLYQVCAQLRDKPEMGTAAFVIVRSQEEDTSHDGDKL